MGTRALEIVAALHALWLESVPDITVVDGPLAITTPERSLWVGYDADPESDFEAVVTDREPSTLDAGYTEIVTITCALVVKSGDGKPATARAIAYGAFDTVTELVDANPSLGLAGVSAHIPGSRLYQRPSGRSGLNELLIFTVVAEVL